MARIGLSSNHKFVRLARTLGSRTLARGILELLWEPCYECGDPYVGTADDLEQMLEWTGAPGALTQALLNAGGSKGPGFIEPWEGRPKTGSAPHYQVHDLLANAPPYVAHRRARELEHSKLKTCERCGEPYHSADRASKFCSPACRQGDWRDRHKETAERNTNVTPGAVTVTARNGSLALAPALAPALAQEDQERLPGDAPPRSGPPAETKAKQPDEVLDADAVLTFPVDGVKGKGKHRNRTTWPLTQRQIDEWAQTYQSLDILDECRRALSWVKANSTRRKTYDGMLAFINSWLSRSVNQRARAPTVYAKSAGNIDAGRQWIQEQAVKHDRRG